MSAKIFELKNGCDIGVEKSPIAITTPHCILMVTDDNNVVAVAKDEQSLRRGLAVISECLDLDIDVDRAVSDARYIGTIDRLRGVPLEDLVLHEEPREQLLQPNLGELFEEPYLLALLVITSIGLLLIALAMGK